jgi:hypothetical protein
MPASPPEAGPPVTRAKGIGKRGTAPCGHDGEHVTTTIVVCDHEWCDGKPKTFGSLADAVPTSIWDCRHLHHVKFNGTESCRDCGKVFKI